MRALLEGLIDYAGLFPPAGLDVARATSNYARYRSGSKAFMLGRFVCPAPKLPELLELMSGPPWPVSVILSGPDDLDFLRTFERGARGNARVEAVEVRTIFRLPVHLYPYYEVPPEEPLPRGGYKLRTGGVTEELFPTAEAICDFILGCHRARRPCKLTAGLHHAMPGRYPLTYDEDSPTTMMHGFVPVMLAAVGLHLGQMTREQAIELIAERDPASFTLEDGGVRWGEVRLSSDMLRVGRQFVHSFGSCSFKEPVEDLEGLGWL